MPIVQKQSNLQQAEDCYIASNLRKTTHYSRRGDSGDVEGIVVIVVFDEEANFLIAKRWVIVYIIW
jgi:hypothetical protein